MITPLAHPLALPFLLCCGILAGACVLYFIARKAFRTQQLIGERFISCSAGLISFAFGGVIPMFTWDVIQANRVAWPFAALPVSLLLLGLYIVPASLFGSDRRIEKIFKGVAGRF